MGRLRPLNICMKIRAIAALGLAYFPESVAVPVSTVREARPLHQRRGPACGFPAKAFLNLSVKEPSICIDRH